MKVLVIEDSKIERLKIEAFLKKLDHSVFMAETGSSGIETYNKVKPDLVLLDVVLPDMYGFEVAKRLRQQESQWFPIIFTSSMDEPQDIVTGISAGGDDYLSKPINIEVLQAKIEAMQRIALMRQDLVSTKQKLLDINQHLQVLAKIDGLTGISNRREFDKRLEMEVIRGNRDHTPVGLMICDIDQFKQFNDHYGHLQGDDCIQTVAAALDSVMKRGSDMVCRYGGEEFAMVISDASMQGMSLLAKQLLDAIRDLKIAHQYSTVKPYVTISIGGVFSDGKVAITTSQLIELADQQLYLVKNGGRNHFKICHVGG
ncbi:diguanylate cyclase [Paraferrimonas sp. SM1919]|uniref:GGDEF domain-containing response regulator n=1 Tax=Paraferrimonas sp. SM1919 TaxID=2662263 RepID=UPI0013CF74CD|nr:diguanylate cyclase [Paraferrimonas sp. SM1919]